MSYLAIMGVEMQGVGTVTKQEKFLCRRKPINFRAIGDHTNEPTAIFDDEFNRTRRRQIAN